MPARGAARQRHRRHRLVASSRSMASGNSPRFSFIFQAAGFTSISTRLTNSAKRGSSRNESKAGSPLILAIASERFFTAAGRTALVVQRRVPIEHVLERAGLYSRSIEGKAPARKRGPYFYEGEGRARRAWGTRAPLVSSLSVY